MQGITSVNGLLSGLDTDSIIAKMIEIEKLPIQQYQAQQTKLNTQLSAYQEANTRLTAVADAANQLANASFFNNRIAASSDPSIATATAAIGATPGDYVVTVNSVARAHQVATQSFGDFNTTTIGTGTFSVTSGGQTTTVQVDSSNNTLAGLRSAINNANTNIRASIIQDGDNSYRLLISAKNTGEANALTINNGLSGGATPAFVDLQPPKDARVTVGSGVNAITVTRSTNSVQDVIPGVTLNLLSEDATNPITVSVGQDTQKIQDAVQNLVDQYNNALDYINSQFSYDADTGTSGALLGDFTLHDVQNQLNQVFSSGVSGLNSGGLADAGITTGANGKLSLDTEALQSKLASDPDSVTNLFALTSQSSSANVQLLSAGPDAVANGSAMAVNITQAATQARVTAGTAIAGPLGADETLTVNGISISLTAGMTQSQVLAAINARTADTGVRAAATAADGTGSGSYLSFTTVNYGSSQKVSIVSSRSSAGGDSSGVGNVAATQASAGGEGGLGSGAAGLNVAGTINGEAATGSGQVLMGNSGNATTDGLRLKITGTQTGSLGTIKLFDGIANSAFRTLDRVTDTTSGPIASEEDSLNERIDDLTKVIADKQDAATRREDALRAKFAALEAQLQQFQSQSQYLSSQLGLNSSSKK